MRAVGHDRYGALVTLRLDEVERPTRKEAESREPEGPQDSVGDL